MAALIEKPVFHDVAGVLYLLSADFASGKEYFCTNSISFAEYVLGENPPFE
jgi:hypothetical protein